MTTETSNAVSVTMGTEEALDFLTMAVKNKMAVLMSGAPGVGKTALGEQVAEITGHNLIKMFPVISDPTDVKGLPAIVEGGAEFLPFGDLKKLMTADEPTMCLIDDLGQAAPVVQASLMQIVLAREIAGHKVSDNVTFVACTNRRQDRAGVSGILEPLKSRFVTIIELQPSWEEWVRWANVNNVDPRVITFIRTRPELLHKFEPTPDMTNSPCPRTVVHVSDVLKLDLSNGMLHKVVAGAAGGEFALEFRAFLDVITEVPDMDYIMEHPEKAPIPKQVDALYAVCGALSRRVTSRKTFESAITYINRISPEFQTVFIMDTKQLYPDVVKFRAFISWVEKNRDMLI